jgi:hypothetical protein
MSSSVAARVRAVLSVVAIVAAAFVFQGGQRWM